MPDEEKTYSPFAILTVVVLFLALAICVAMVRIQISVYSARSLPLSPVCSGRRNVSPAGRMASWASWAFLLLLRKVRTFSLRYSAPNSFSIWLRAASMHSFDRLTLSVLMYVMKPFSNRDCAMRIVSREDRCRRLEAACCSVDVVKGGWGFDTLGFMTTLVTSYSGWSLHHCMIASQSPLDRRRALLSNAPVMESKSLPVATLSPDTLSSTAVNDGKSALTS